MTLRLHPGRARHSVRAALGLTPLLSHSRRARNGAPCLIVFLLSFTWLAARAQTADEFFNGGAQFYISNNIPDALERTENGLKLYPDDVKLKKLEELLKQQQQSQSQQNQQNQSQSQDGQSQQKQNQQPPQQNQQQNQQEKKPSPQNPEQQKQQPPQSGEKNNEESRNGKEMTPQEAQQLLDAQKGNEQFLTLKPDGKPPTQNRPTKDW